MLAVPFSLVGAVWLLYLLDYNMSVAVWVGIIALAGLDAETGVVMLLYLTLAHGAQRRDGHARTQRRSRARRSSRAPRKRHPPEADDRRDDDHRPRAACSGARGTGADVMKRIAAPMVGGLVTSFLLELLVYPAIFAIWKGRALPRALQDFGVCSTTSCGMRSRSCTAFIAASIEYLMALAGFAQDELESKKRISS